MVTNSKSDIIESLSRSDLIGEKIDEIRDSINSSDIGTEEKNVLLDTMDTVELISKEVSDAHQRIGNRKNEYHKLSADIQILSQEISTFSSTLKEYIATQNNLINEYHKKVEEVIKSDKKQNIFISIAVFVISFSAISSMSSASLLKGIWSVIQKLPI